jgi:hypothetical protein
MVSLQAQLGRDKTVSDHQKTYFSEPPAGEGDIICAAGAIIRPIVCTSWVALRTSLQPSPGRPFEAVTEAF